MRNCLSGMNDFMISSSLTHSPMEWSICLFVWLLKESIWPFRGVVLTIGGLEVDEDLNHSRNRFDHWIYLTSFHRLVGRFWYGSGSHCWLLFHIVWRTFLVQKHGADASSLFVTTLFFTVSVYIILKIVFRMILEAYWMFTENSIVL